jgi:hypothetical protein
VTDFLSKKGRRDLATIHYLMNDDLTAATEQALKASSLEASAHGQTVLLSIAKLATATIAARGETLLGSAFSRELHSHKRSIRCSAHSRPFFLTA